MNITIELPWPAKELSPNARPHWAPLAKAKKEARHAAKIMTLVEMVTFLNYPESKTGRIKLRWTFCPPTRRAYDDDNLESSCKAYRDGIADALGIDDSRFKATKRTGEVVKGGKIIVSIGD